MFYDVLGRLVANEIGDVQLLKSAMERLNASKLFEEASVEAKRRRDAIESSKEGIAFVKSSSSNFDEDVRASKRRRLDSEEKILCYLVQIRLQMFWTCLTREVSWLVVTKCTVPRLLRFSTQFFVIAIVLVVVRNLTRSFRKLRLSFLFCLSVPVYDLRANLRPSSSNDTVSQEREGQENDGTYGMDFWIGDWVNRDKVGTDLYKLRVTNLVVVLDTVPQKPHLPSTLQFQSKLSKCTKQDQARALERLLSPVFELRGVIKEKMEVDDEEEENNEEEETTLKH